MVNTIYIMLTMGARLRYGSGVFLPPPDSDRCTHRYNDHFYPPGPACCLVEGHKGPHRYRCASPQCRGKRMPASVMPHQHGRGDAIDF
jgi:hypothetical protein